MPTKNLVLVAALKKLVASDIKPPTPAEFYREVEKLLAPLFEVKPVLKTEKKSQLYGKENNPAPSIKFYFDLTDFDGEKKSQWSTNSSWLWVGMTPIADHFGKLGYEFLIEYTDGDPGMGHSIWNVIGSDVKHFSLRGSRVKSSIQEAWLEFKKHLTELTHLDGGKLKGPSYWND